MSNDNIEFNISVNTGDAIANIRAVNAALSDFSRNSLQQVRKSEDGFEKWAKTTKWAIGVMEGRRSKNIAWIKDTDDQLKNLIKTSTAAGEVLQSIPSGSRQTRRASMATGGDVVKSGGVTLDQQATYHTPSQRFSSWTGSEPSRPTTRVTRPAGPPEAGSGFSRTTDSVKQLDAAQTRNISTLERWLDRITQANRGLGYMNERNTALRYALYDVSNASAMAAAGFAAFPIAAMAGAIKAERAFADVKRTTGLAGTEAENLRKEFINLSQTMPIAFADVSKIGTLAGQLGVANEQLTAFTKSVVQFSTVTNMSGEESATAFARLNDLLPDVEGNYNALGSAILKVGTESAATESEITAVAQQIAPVANSFNISADAVIGYAGALASLKVPPELSRGMLQRTFAEVNSAISANSAQLDAWGRTIGMTGQEFKKAWLGDSATTFANVLRAIGQSGGAAESTLVQLGITSSRDAATIKRLAQNVDSTLIPALNNAKDAYTSGNEAQQQYDEIAGTLAERLNMLTSNLQNFLNAAGSGVSVFGSLIDAANWFLKTVTDIINNPFGKWFFIITGAIAGLASGLLLTISVLSRLKASFLAAKLVMDGLYGGIKNTIVAFQAQRASALSGGLAMNGFKASVIAAGVSLQGLKTALISTGIGALIVLAGTLVAGLIDLASSSQNADQAAQDAFGSFTDLRSAMEADAQTAKNAGKEHFKYGDYLVANNKIIDQNGNLITMDSKYREENAGFIEEQTKKLNEMNVAIGSQTKGKIADALIGNEDFKKLEEWNKQVSQAGRGDLAVDIPTLLDLMTSDDPAKAKQYVDGIKKNVNDALMNTGDLANVSLDLFNISDRAGKIGEVVATGLGGAASSVLRDWTNGTAGAKTATEEWSQSLDDAIKGMEEARSNAERGFNMSDSIGSAADSMQGLMDALAKSGGTMNAGFADGRAAANSFKSTILDMVSLAQGMGLSAAEGVNIVFQQAMNNGADAADMQQQLNGLVDAGTISYAQMLQIMGGTFKMSTKAQGLADQFGKLKSNASGAAKEVRTLIDYANDLANVWKRAFSIRFDSMLNLDAIASSWKDIADSTKEARDQIQKLNDDIDSLTADKSLKEYFLSVAEAMGDTVKAAQLRSEIAKINSDLTDKNKELTDAQNASNKTLVGNSAAAINNRKTITGMVGSYQTYIQSLAASGASQETINAAIKQSKSDFVAQATQLGYNATELKKYSVAFDDMSKAVKDVPRNVTVKANTDPAIQALNEYTAKVNKTTANVKIGAAFDNSAFEKTARGNNLQLEYSRISSQRMREGDWADTRMKQINKMLESGKYYSGGYTGAGGKYDIAGIVHRGEYVIPKEGVNQATGMPYFMSQPRAFASGGYAGASGPMMVTLAPEDRALLRQAGGSGEVVLYANNEAIARSSNAGNQSIIAFGGRP